MEERTLMKHDLFIRGKQVSPPLNNKITEKKCFWYSY